MQRHTIAIVFLLIVNFLSAQDCNKTLTGQVIDFHDGSPLKGAYIKFNNRTITTDANGTYHIDNLCPTAYAFTISHEACNSQVTTVNIANVSSKTIYLEHHHTDLDQVDLSVTAEKKATNSLTESELGKKLLDEYSNQSLGDALKNISGINSLASGNTIVKPIIQGLHSSRIIMMNNGVRQEDQEWGEEHAPNLDLNAFNSIKVIKGSGALQYGGNAIAGVIITENKLTALKDTLFGKTQITANSNGRGGGINSNLNIGFNTGWRSKLQGTLKHFGDSETPDYILSNSGHREQSFSASIGFSKFLYGFDAYYSFYNTTQGILRASHIGNIGDLTRAINADTPLFFDDFTYTINAPKQKTQHHLIKLSFYNRFKNLGKFNLQYSFQNNNRKEFDIRRGEDRNTASLDLELLSQGLESSFQFDSNDNFKKNIGFQLSYQKNTPNPRTNVKRLIPDYEKLSAGIFAITEFKINNQINGDLGIRYDFVNIDAKKYYTKKLWAEREYGITHSNSILTDYNNQWLTNLQLDYHNIAASAGINYMYSNSQILLINISLANRAPNPVELFSDGLHHSAAIIEIGDLRFKQEKSLKFSLSTINPNLFNLGDLTVSPYISIINDFILLKPTGIDFTIRGAFPVWEYQQTNALLYGVDIDYAFDITKNIKFNTAFSYTNGQDTTKNIPLINMPAPNFRSSITYEKEKWNLKLTNYTVLKQTRYPNNNFETEFIENSELVNKLVDISTPPNGYSILDISANYKFKIRNPSDFSTGVRISNVLNTSYRDYLNRHRYYADNTGINFQINLKDNF